MIDKMKTIFTEAVRGWVYRVLLAVGVLVAGFGWLASDKVALIMGVVVAVLNIMPVGNTSISKPSGDMYIPDET